MDTGQTRSRISLRMRLLVSLSVVVALFAFGAPADAEVLRFGRTSVAYTTQPLTARAEGVTAFAMGWRRCDPSAAQQTTRAPILSWTVAEQMELRIRLEDDRGNPASAGGVILLP